MRALHAMLAGSAGRERLAGAKTCVRCARCWQAVLAERGLRELRYARAGRDAGRQC